MSPIGPCLLQFAISMYMQLRAEHGHRNILCSPLSTGTALSMTMYGSGGNTSKQLFSALHLKRCGSGVDKHFSNLLDEVSKYSSNALLLTANRMYVDRTFKIRDTYRLLLQSLFESSIELADFTDNAEGVRSEINSWVSKRTESKVRHLLPHGSVENGTQLVLINALYFKAFWQMPFKESNLKKPFSVNSQRVVDVVMMHRHGKFRFAYADDLLSVAVELPYKGGQCSMVIFLPFDVEGLRSVEERLSEDALHSVVSQLSLGYVALTVPKFKLDLRPNLKRTLQSLGVRDLFEPGVANLSGMVESGELWLSDIFHEAHLRVDEEGTEGAAATAEVAAAGGSWHPPDQSAITYINVDHPFLFVVRDNVQDVILFMGSLVDPTVRY